MKKTKKSNLTGLLRPYSMEEKKAYIARFNCNRYMIDLFPDAAQRVLMAEQVFKEKWAEAQVTVTKLDGSQFFID